MEFSLGNRQTPEVPLGQTDQCFLLAHGNLVEPPKGTIAQSAASNLDKRTASGCIPKQLSLKGSQVGSRAGQDPSPPGILEPTILGERQVGDAEGFPIVPGLQKFNDHQKEIENMSL